MNTKSPKSGGNGNVRSGNGGGSSAGRGATDFKGVIKLCSTSGTPYPTGVRTRRSERPRALRTFCSSCSTIPVSQHGRRTAAGSTCRRCKGSPTGGTYNHYPTGWAAAFSTPFKMFKRYSEYSGGTCDPLIISWPKGIEARGEIFLVGVTIEKTQYLDLEKVAAAPYAAD